MIVGIGTDIVEIARIRRSLEKFGERFAGKILGESELVRFRTVKEPAAWLARRFAAKEAAAKALGTGMRGGVHFVQIEIRHQKSGAPLLDLTGRAAARADKLGVNNSHVSISDERDFAVAFVILEN